MMRKSKILGATLIAIAAIGALAASTASAEMFVFTAEAEDTTLKGGQVGSSKMTVDAGTLTCESGSFTETMSGEAALDLKMDPSYSGCTALGLATTVDMNSCYYILTAITKEGSNYEAKLSIECEEAGDSIDITPKLASTTKCIVEVGEQAKRGTVTISEEGTPTELKASISLTGIEYDQTAGTGLGACTKAENTSNGTFEATIMLEDFEGESQANLASEPLPQTVKIKQNPITFDKDGKATYEIENQLNEEVELLATILPQPTGTVKAIDKCVKLPKKGDKGSTCTEELQCLKASGKKGLPLGLITSPIGGTMTKLENC